MRTLLQSLFAACICSTLPSLAQAVDPSQPPAGQHAVLTVQGRGSQIYSCQPVAAGFQWLFRAPVARLFDTGGNEVGTHGDGPTWVMQDSSSVQGAVLATAPSPDATSIPWLLLKAHDPQRTGVLTTVEFIRRSDTKGGTAPVTGCDATHEGDLARTPYTATYTFYSSQPTATAK